MGWGSPKQTLAYAGARPIRREPAWSIDLRDYRQVDSLDIQLEAWPSADTPLSVMSSIDGIAWRELASVRKSAGQGSHALTLGFPEPVLARHIGLGSCAPSAVNVASVKVYTRAVSLAYPGLCRDGHPVG